MSPVALEEREGEADKELSCQRVAGRKKKLSKLPA